MKATTSIIKVVPTVCAPCFKTANVMQTLDGYSRNFFYYTIVMLLYHFEAGIT